MFKLQSKTPQGAVCPENAADDFTASRTDTMAFCNWKLKVEENLMAALRVQFRHETSARTC